MSGDTPESICPVIIPGKETRPTANNMLVMGMSAARKATPLASLNGVPCLISASRRSHFPDLGKHLPYVQFLKVLLNGVIHLNIGQLVFFVS